MFKFVCLLLTESKEGIYFGKMEKRSLFKGSTRETEGPKQSQISQITILPCTGE